MTSWAVKDVRKNVFVADRLTKGVTFGTREKARQVKKRNGSSRHLRVTRVALNELANQPRA